ncbi:MAG: hypothetical protein QNJ62_04925 [Methyloceanibacter sp.]|nr:hypothetical protein [Methyloceanibacter sp.]
MKTLTAIAAITLLAGCSGLVDKAGDIRDTTIEKGAEGLASTIRIQCSRGIEWRQKVLISVSRELESQTVQALDCNGDEEPDFTLAEAIAANPDF